MTNAHGNEPEQAEAAKPTVMTDLVERLDALDAKRTPGPWEQDQSAIHTADLMTIRIVDCGGLQHRTGPGQHTIPAYYHQSVDNAAFIVALENAWPTIRAALATNSAPGSPVGGQPSNAAVVVPNPSNPIVTELPSEETIARIIYEADHESGYDPDDPKTFWMADDGYWPPATKMCVWEVWLEIARAILTAIRAGEK